MNRAESVRRIEADIRRARAEALGRAGERLEAALREVAEADRRLDRLIAALGAGAARDPRVRQEAAARERARAVAVELDRQLRIQREAVGLSRHAAVEERYPIPPRRDL